MKIELNIHIDTDNNYKLEHKLYEKYEPTTYDIVIQFAFQAMILFFVIGLFWI